ncbi:hypothetical protein MSAN_02290800 [Mycena sanguinolenta]|uniref:Uncharacterized protein n=1 Tax=Mycena sanguinolenta TaxID=230812 RepID=A0A8H6X9R5_9AGAR|nr:hypothetical protein MSAN_02290800 [Mycena sanguinolenta]
MSDPSVWIALAQLSAATCHLMADLRYRTLCVTASPLDLRGFPSDGPDDHLLFKGWAVAYHRMFERCPGLRSLWIDDCAGLGTWPKLRGLQSLGQLRELTLPLAYASLESGTFVSISLPTVTHLFFCCVHKYCSFHPDTLAAFPTLTHLGFAAEPKHSIVSFALQRSPAVGILVRGPGTTEAPVHSRLVYLLRNGLDPFTEWLVRAAPHWQPRGQRRPCWDQWTVFDRVMAARTGGRLLPEEGAVAHVWEHEDDVRRMSAP